MGRRRAEQPMSEKLQRVAERAVSDPQIRFTSLAHLVDEDELRLAFDRTSSRAATGIDGRTKEQYGQDLETRLRDLHGRLRLGRYRHQPIRRVHIPKGPGREGTRPLGVSCIEDKVVQGAITRVLQTVFEPVFSDCSYGFRRGRSGHDAIRSINQMAMFEGVTWILEADIQSFFDSIDRQMLMEMLQQRVVDRSMLRLVGKCLHVGVLDGEEFTKPEEGTAQGSVISPLLGNIYLHYVLDDWFEQAVRPELHGHAKLVRYADDFVIGFASKDDAEHVLEKLRARMAQFGLQLHPEKTRLIPFGRPPKSSKTDGGSGTFDFLGFTMYWERSRKGGWRLGMKTRKASYRKGLASLARWCRRHRHLSMCDQHARLSRSLNGHYNYFAVNGNRRALERFYEAVRRVWFKWLRRRSQRARKLTWERFQQYLDCHPLPRPRIKVQVWLTP